MKGMLDGALQSYIYSKEQHSSKNVYKGPWRVSRVKGAIIVPRSDHPKGVARREK